MFRLKAQLTTSAPAGHEAQPAGTSSRALALALAAAAPVAPGGGLNGSAAAPAAAGASLEAGGLRSFTLRSDRSSSARPSPPLSRVTSRSSPSSSRKNSFASLQNSSASDLSLLENSSSSVLKNSSPSVLGSSPPSLLRSSSPSLLGSSSLPKKSSSPKNSLPLENSHGMNAPAEMTVNENPTSATAAAGKSRLIPGVSETTAAVLENTAHGDYFENRSELLSLEEDFDQYLPLLRKFTFLRQTPRLSMFALADLIEAVGDLPPSPPGAQKFTTLNDRLITYIAHYAINKRLANFHMVSAAGGSVTPLEWVSRKQFRSEYAFETALENERSAAAYSSWLDKSGVLKLDVLKKFVTETLRSDVDTRMRNLYGPRKGDLGAGNNTLQTRQLEYQKALDASGLATTASAYSGDVENSLRDILSPGSDKIPLIHKRNSDFRQSLQSAAQTLNKAYSKLSSCGGSGKRDVSLSAEDIALIEKHCLAVASKSGHEVREAERAVRYYIAELAWLQQELQQAEPSPAAMATFYKKGLEHLMVEFGKTSKQPEWMTRKSPFKNWFALLNRYHNNIDLVYFAVASAGGPGQTLAAATRAVLLKASKECLCDIASVLREFATPLPEEDTTNSVSLPASDGGSLAKNSSSYAAGGSSVM